MLCDYQIPLLLPQTRVLTYCYMAMAAIISDDPVFIGSKDGSALPHPTGILQFKLVETDLRPWGEHREPILLHMVDEAFLAAKDEAITLEITRENAASSSILDFLSRRQS